MPLNPGTRLGPYAIIGPLGAGGMGEVYRARDTRLDREVAIKVLPARFSADPERLRRFHQEARAAGQLHHPNILTVHDMGTFEGSPYLVTELLEGEALRKRLDEGPLPLRTALDLATQIARGVQAAHEKSIVHRDLKPENLLVGRDGWLKILDFGLAKLMSPREDAAGMSQAPTRAAETEPGTVMGTVSYMSPEQVRGIPADHRSDIFSFGAILYEMLSGRRAFQRETSAETMTAILREEPPGVAANRKDLPLPLVRLVELCLRKAPEDRPASAREILEQLDAVSRLSAPAGQRARAWPVRFGWALAALLPALALALFIYLRPDSHSPPGSSPRLTQITLAEGVEDSPAWSPDSLRIAYSVEAKGIRHIYLKELEPGKEEPLTRGDFDEIQPAFTPDGRTVLFVRAQLPAKRLEPGDIFGQYSGGDIWARDLASDREWKVVENASNPAPSPDGAWIALDAAWLGPSRIWLVDRQGHNPLQLTSDSSEAVAHLRPRWSSDGARIVFQSLERTKFDIRVVEVASKKMTWVTDDLFQDIGPVFAPSGRYICFSTSRTGGLNLWRIPVGPEGSPAGRPEQLTSGAGQDLNPAISPDGRRIAFSILGQNASIWRLPVSPETGRPTGPPQELISTTREESRGAWSPLGDRIAFNSDRTGEMNIWLTTLHDGSTRQLTLGPGGDFQPSWSPDGRRLVFFSSRSRNADIWSVDVSSGELRRLTRNPAIEINPFYSPDGRRVAYQSDASGRLEIWLMDADGGAQRQITSVGVSGHFMRWTSDGRFVVFLCPGGGQPRILGVSTEGGEPEPLPKVAGGSHISFSPDQSRVMDVVGHKTLWVSPLNGGEPEKVYEFEDPSVRIDYPVWSPDGKWVLFDRFSPRGGDIWMLEGLGDVGGGP